MSVPTREQDRAMQITGGSASRCYPPRMPAPRRPALAPIGLALLLSGCGPTKDQIATTILVALPIAMSIAMVGTLALRRAWGHEVSFPPWGIATVIVGLLVSGLLSTSADFDVELIAPVLSFTAAALLAQSLFFGRVRFSAPAERSVVLTPLVVALVFALPPALVMLDVVPPDNAELCLVVGVYAILGSAMLSPLVALALVIERAWRATHPRRGDAGSGPSDLDT